MELIVCFYSKYVLAVNIDANEINCDSVNRSNLFLVSLK